MPFLICVFAVWAHAGEGFARNDLSVGEDHAVYAFKSVLNVRQGDCFVDRSLFNVGRVNAIESESQILIFVPVSDCNAS